MKKSTVIILSAILVVICGVAGFMVGTKMAEKEKTTETTQEVEKNNDKKEVEEVKEETVKQITAKIDKLSYLDYLGKNISSPNAIPIETLQRLVFQLLSEDNKAFTKANFENVVKEYFGDIKVNHKDYYDGLCEEAYYLWDEKKEMYVENKEHGAHGIGVREIHNRIENVEYADGIYTVTVYKFISETSEFVNLYFYASIEDAENKRNQLYELTEEDLNAEYEDRIAKVRKELENTPESKLVKYTYTFDSNLALQSYKIG